MKRSDFKSIYIYINYKQQAFAFIVRKYKLSKVVATRKQNWELS